MGLVFFLVFFSKAPKVMVFFLVFSKTPWLWSSSSWPKSQSCGLLLHGFFQSSQSCGLFLPSFFPKLHGYDLFLPSQNLKVVVLFFMGFSKAPKAIFFFMAITSKPRSFSFWIFPKLPKLLSFSSRFFLKLPKFSKLCSSYSWFFPKIPWLWSFSSWLKPWSCGILFHGFFQSSHLFPGYTLKTMVFFFLDFSKVSKVIVLFLVFPKVPWSWSSCASFGYWSACPLSYSTPWLFIALRFLNSHSPYPPCFLF